MKDPFMASVYRRIADRKKVFKALMNAPFGFAEFKVNNIVMRKKKGRILVRTKSIGRKPTRGERYTHKEMLSKKHGLVLGR